MSYLLFSCETIYEFCQLIAFLSFDFIRIQDMNQTVNTEIDNELWQFLGPQQKQLVHDYLSGNVLSITAE